MKIKQLIENDFVNYKKPSMVIGMPSCTFKCCKEQGLPVEICQNCELTKWFDITVDPNYLVQRFLSSKITSAVVIGGLEPMDSFSDLIDFIESLRKQSNCDIVIYTGYNRNEVEDKIQKIKNVAKKNVIVKFGRYISNQKPHYDAVLGVDLASDNQYGEVIC